MKKIPVLIALICFDFQTTYAQKALILKKYAVEYTDLKQPNCPLIGRLMALVFPIFR
jgi:hypothetical protein